MQASGPGPVAPPLRLGRCTAAAGMVAVFVPRPCRALRPPHPPRALCRSSLNVSSWPEGVVYCCEPTMPAADSLAYWNSQYAMRSGNPHFGLISFDNVLFSFLLIFQAPAPPSPVRPAPRLSPRAYGHPPRRSPSRDGRL